MTHKQDTRSNEYLKNERFRNFGEYTEWWRWKCHNLWRRKKQKSGEWGIKPINYMNESIHRSTSGENQEEIYKFSLGWFLYFGLPLFAYHFWEILHYSYTVLNKFLYLSLITHYIKNISQNLTPYKGASRAQIENSSSSQKLGARPGPSGPAVMQFISFHIITVDNFTVGCRCRAPAAPFYAYM